MINLYRSSPPTNTMSLSKGCTAMVLLYHPCPLSQCTEVAGVVFIQVVPPLSETYKSDVELLVSTATYTLSGLEGAMASSNRAPLPSPVEAASHVNPRSVDFTTPNPFSVAYWMEKSEGCATICCMRPEPVKVFDQDAPPSVDRKMPVLVAARRMLSSAGSTMMRLT